MLTENIFTEKLFSYGTLQYESVQLATFQRKLTGTRDTLTGYRLEQLEIKDANVLAASGTALHPILIYTGNIADTVEGTVFAIDQQELLQADQYEVEDYKRVSVQLSSGVNAWVYVSI